jgi:hypothetical protein
MHKILVLYIWCALHLHIIIDKINDFCIHPNILFRDLHNLTIQSVITSS